jgi:hypothetical protein
VLLLEVAGDGEKRGLILTDTTRCHVGSNHDRALSGLELVEDPVSLVLLLVSVDC